MGTVMRVFLTLILLFILGAQATEKFSQIIKVGKTKGKCSFNLSYSTTAVDLSKSRVTCQFRNLKKSITSIQSVSAPSGFVFEIKLKISKKDTKILSAEVSHAPTTTTAKPTTTTTTTTTATTTTTTTKVATEETSTPTRAGKQVTEETLPGDWVVIQRRGQYGNEADYFTKTMDKYVAGFADNDESWLGLEEMARMTESGTWELQVELMDWSGRMGRATYGD